MENELVELRRMRAPKTRIGVASTLLKKAKKHIFFENVRKIKEPIYGACWDPKRESPGEGQNWRGPDSL